MKLAKVVIVYFRKETHVFQSAFMLHYYIGNRTGTWYGFSK